MSNQKTLSHLSFAAVALLAAAIPCLAQTESPNARHSQAGAPNLAQTAEIAALRNERLSVYKAAPKTASAFTNSSPRAFRRRILTPSEWCSAACFATTIAFPT